MPIKSSRGLPFISTISPMKIHSLPRSTQSSEQWTLGPELFGPFFFSVNPVLWIMNFGSGIVWAVFFPLCFVYFLFCPLSLLFAAFWSWKVPAQRYLQQFWVWTSNCPSNLQHFGALWSILELEAARSTVFAALLSSNLSFSMEFATFWCSNCSWNRVVCN